MILLNSLSLSMKNKIYVTESVAPKVTINPANATFGSYTLYSSDTSVAKIVLLELKKVMLLLPLNLMFMMKY